MQIEKHKVVGIDYVLTDSGGEVIDSSEDGDPLVYIHGIGNLIPGLEDALAGRGEGDAFEVSIPPAAGYGDRNEELAFELERQQFEGVENLEVGMQFEMETDGGGQIFTIVELEGDAVRVDGNHVLAGQTLNFAVKVRQIREATEEEISHGHVHGPGGHHH